MLGTQVPTYNPDQFALDNIVFDDNLVAHVAGPGIGAAGPAGVCPAIDLQRNACWLGGYEADGSKTITGCNMIRECDPYTAAQHMEYLLPGGPSGNVNIWTLDRATGGFVYTGPNGVATTPPNWASAPQTVDNTFVSNVNSKVVQDLNRFGNSIGMSYNPSSGWTLQQNVAPDIKTPTIPAFTRTGAVSGPASSGSTPNVGTATGQGPTQGGTNNAGGTMTAKTPPKTNIMLIVVVGALILLAMKG